MENEKESSEANLYALEANDWFSVLHAFDMLTDDFLKDAIEDLPPQDRSIPT